MDDFFDEIMDNAIINLNDENNTNKDLEEDMDHEGTLPEKMKVISRKNRQNKMNANPCEVRRFQNKQCVNDCMFAPLFPSSDPQKFDVVNRIFGLETLTFYLKDLSPMERIDTTRTLYYEAKPCFLNPPKNPSKFLETLLNYPYQKAEEVSKTKKLLASYSRPCVVLALPAPKYTQSKPKPSVLRKRKRKTKSSDESSIHVVEDS